MLKKRNVWVKGGYVMSGIAKGMMFILVLLYVVSPVDLCPGPIDDLIVLLISAAASKANNYIEG